MTTNLPATRPANPLARASGGPLIDPVQRLRDHIAKLNNYRWVTNSGKLYFVNQRTKADGTTEHYVDRYI